MSMPAGLSNSEVHASIESWLTEDTPVEAEAEEVLEEAQAEATPDEEVVSEEGGDEDEPLAAESNEEDETEVDDSSEGEEVIDSVLALAEHFGVEESEVLENLEVENPFGQKVSIGEALNNWRETEGFLKQRQDQLEQSFNEKMDEANVSVDKHLTQLQVLATSLADHIKSEYSEEVLRDARFQDPDKYVELVDKRNNLMKLIEQSADAYELHATAKQKQSDQDIQNLIQKEHQVLLEKKPEWMDNGKRSSDLANGQRLLLSIGFTQEDIDSVVDHRVLLLTDLAVKGSSISKSVSEKSVDELRKRGLKKPSIGLRTKSRKDPENQTNKAKAKARAKFAKSGSVSDAARLIEDLI